MPQDKDVFASKEAMVYGDTNRRISEDDEGDEELEDDLLSSEDDQDLEQDYLFSEDNCYWLIGGIAYLISIKGSQSFIY